MIPKEKIESCTFLRRMGAVLYDTLLVFSVMLFATIPYLIFSGGEAIDSGNKFFQVYLLMIGVLYFIVPWKIRGQTLGMQSWRIKVVQETGELISWGQAMKRVLFSGLSWLPAGLGFFWSLSDQEKLAWHDRLSKTKLIHLQSSDEKT